MTTIPAIEPALQTILDLAQRHRDETTAREAQWLAQRLASGELTILIAGQFKRGKSTVINALLGEELLPTGVLPLTSVATMIHYGTEKRAVVRFGDGRCIEIATAELKQYVTEAENPENRLGVAHVDVEMPSALLEGVRLVDTPGIASAFVHNTQAARESLREADATVLVVGPEPPIGEAEISFAKEIVRASQRLFVIFNKADLAAQREADLVEFTTQQLRKAIGISPQIFVVSALAGQTDARFAAFTFELRRFLEQHRDSTRRKSLQRKCATLARRLCIAISMRRHALLLPSDERRAAFERFTQLASVLHERADDLGTALDRGLRDDKDRIAENLRERYENARAKLVRSLEPIAATGDVEAFESALESGAAAETRAWVDIVCTLLESKTRERAALLYAHIAQLEDEVLRLGLQALNLTQTIPSIALEAFDVPGLALERARIADTGLELTLKGGFALLPKTIRARMLRKRLPEAVREKLDARHGRMRYAAVQELERVRTALRGAIQSRIAAAERAVIDALQDTLQPAEANLEHRVIELSAQEAVLQGIAGDLEAARDP